MLYRYLYVLENPSRALVLWFPNITEIMWRQAAASGNRKDVRLFRIAADAILFADQLLSAGQSLRPVPFGLQPPWSKCFIAYLKFCRRIGDAPLPCYWPGGSIPCRWAHASQF